ncbi:MAG TPA: amino acid adenylation domain-containing protein, partial [Thermoanaerobaculia bacterium]
FPDQVALVFEDQHLSYAELNRRANQLAHYLRRLGVAPEVVVGLCVERSVEMIVGLLAIIKAGGAYLPLDPQYPRRRLTYMLDDAGVELVVTTAALAADGLFLDRQVIRLDRDWPAISQQDEQNPLAESAAENLAYVIYTSGSSGEPKGVMVEQRGVCNMAEAQMQSLAVSRRSCGLQFASLSFDASIFEIMLMQRAGGKLCLGAAASLLPGGGLEELLKREAVTHVTLPPTALAQIRAGGMAEVEGLIVAGEACRAELVSGWGKGRKFYNAYGPTEASVWASVKECGAGRGEGEGDPSIGSPIGNVQMYILDEAREVVPAGSRGELYIGGGGLARGYRGRAALTAERFMPNGYSAGGGERLYRSGDVGRYGSNGEIEYLGRGDEQVKLRGYRIEMGEIEAGMREHEGVSECVVMVREEAEGEKRLVAYVVSKQAGELNISQLREHLKQRLPAYMVPSAYVMLPALPLTANGKLDRGALPAAEPSQREEGESVAGPRNAVEEIVSGIWSQVLRAEQVGIEDNFFDLGGHSLLATQVISRIRQAFQVEVALRTMFERPTVGGLAEVIEQARARGERQAEVRIEAVGREQRLRLSNAQERLWFLDELRPGSSAYNISTAIQLSGRLEVAGLEQSLTEIMRRHEVLRTHFEIYEGQPVQVIEAVKDLRLAIVDLEGISETARKREVRRLASAEAGR